MCYICQNIDHRSSSCSCSNSSSLFVNKKQSIRDRKLNPVNLLSSGTQQIGIKQNNCFVIGAGNIAKTCQLIKISK